MKYQFPASFDLGIVNNDCSVTDEDNLMLDIINKLWKKYRTLVSDGYHDSLQYLNEYLPVDTIATPSGKDVWSWKVPKKWSVNEAWIKSNGNVVCDYNSNSLHLASYSVPFKGVVSKEELMQHLCFNVDRPNAIPYAYHYYKPNWSFSLSYNDVQEMGDGPFEVCVDTSFEDGFLEVGEVVIPGDSPETIILCSHLCHPNQVNDGLSGVAVGIALMKRLSELSHRRYTYRLVLCPENIGSVCYLYNRQDEIKNFKYGMILEMLGNKNHLKLQYSKQGDTDIDYIAEDVLSDKVPVFGVGDFRKVICNDEINFNGPGINIPTISLSRWPYPEYHTSDDNPDIISLKYLREAVDVCWQTLMHLEKNVIPKPKYTANLFLSKYDLYEDLNVDDTIEQIILAFDGESSVKDIAVKLNMSLDRVESYVDKFAKAGLVDIEEAKIDD